MPDFRRPSAHEAGHTVVALFHGFKVARIESFQGVFRVRAELDAADKTDDQRFLFLAGGVAGETLVFGDYEPGPSKNDQDLTTQHGGGSIDTYRPGAERVIEANQKCFQELRDKIAKRAIQKTMEMQISGGSNSFVLMTGEEVQQVWVRCQGQGG